MLTGVSDSRVPLGSSGRLGRWAGSGLSLVGSEILSWEDRTSLDLPLTWLSLRGMLPVGGTVMTAYKLVDQVKCVVCGHVWYVDAQGKSSRTFNGMCIGDHVGLSKEDESKSKQAELPGGNARKG